MGRKKIKFKMIEDVMIERHGKEVEYHVPTYMSGKEFEAWQDRNEKEINKFKTI